MKLGNIDTLAAVLLVVFASEFNEEYQSVSVLLEDATIENFEVLPGKGWRLTTNKHRIQFHSKDFQKIKSIAVFDLEGKLVGDVVDLGPIVQIASQISGLPYDEVAKMAKDIFGAYKKPPEDNWKHN